MTYCPECGAETESEWNHCQICGTNLPTQAKTEKMSSDFDSVNSKSNLPLGQKGLFAGSGIIGIGALLPWMSVNALGTTLTKRGVDGDGVITLVLAFLIAGAGIYQWSKKTQIVGVVGGVIVTWLSGIYIVDPLAGVTTESPDITQYAISIEMGLYLTIIGGAIAMLSSAYGFVNEGSPDSSKRPVEEPSRDTPVTDADTSDQSATDSTE